MEVGSLECCNVCRKTMIDPRILECSHSFCLKCLESSTVSDESPRCPTCQIAFLRPQGGIKYLKKNEFIEQLNNLKESNINCDVCSENEAVKYCVECSFNYCSTCLVPHSRIPTSSKHQLLSEMSRSYRKNFISSCDEHSKLITLFCKSCKVVLCDHCLALNHKDHRTESIASRLDSVRQNIEKNLNKNNEIVNNVNISLQEVQEKICEFEMLASNLKKGIKKRCENMKGVVNSIEAKLIGTIDEELQKHKEGSGDVVTELKNMEESLNEQSETLKQKLNTLTYENIADEPVKPVIEDEIIPKYYGNFGVSFFCEVNEPRINLKMMFGAIRKGWQW